MKKQITAFFERIIRFFYNVKEHRINGAFLQAVNAVSMTVAYNVVTYLMYVDIVQNKGRLSDYAPVLAIMFAHQAATFSLWYKGKSDTARERAGEVARLLISRRDYNKSHESDERCDMK